MKRNARSTRVHLPSSPGGIGTQGHWSPFLLAIFKKLDEVEFPASDQTSPHFELHPALSQRVTFHLFLVTLCYVSDGVLALCIFT